MKNAWLKLLIIALFVLLDFILNLSKSAVVTINDASVAKKAEDNDKKAKELLKLIQTPINYTNSISTALICSQLVASSFLALSFIKWFAQGVCGRLQLYSYSKPILVLSMLAFNLVLAFLYIVFGKIIAEKIGAVKCDTLAYSTYPVLKFITFILKPFCFIIEKISNGILLLFGIDPHAAEEEVTEEEIMMMVDAGKEKGVIEQTQRSMINNIFEFDDTVISEIMTHRTDIIAAEITQSIKEVIDLAIENGYSRIPVYEEDPDNIKGIVYIKDLLKYIGKKLPNITIKDIMRDVYYVPESKKCADLFTEMTEKHLQMCIVADEYGGTAGLVTVEDLLEVIVGNMQDEYDDAEEEVTIINETTFTIDGVTAIDDASELLGVELPEGEYDTVGGMIMSVIGKIPRADEKCEIEIANCLFKVLNINERRIERVLVEKLPQPIPEQD